MYSTSMKNSDTFEKKSCVSSEFKTNPYEHQLDTFMKEQMDSAFC